MKPRALLIDLDGTIVDSSEAFTRAAERTLEEFRCAANPETVGLDIARRLQLNLPMEACFGKAAGNRVSGEDFLRSFLRAFYEFAPTTTVLLPSAGDALAELSKRFRLALVTRRPVPKDSIRNELKRLDVDQCFTAIVTSLDVANSSPAPDAFLKAAEKLQVPIQDCAVVSDSGVDIRAGRAAGAKTVAVLSGLFTEDELRKDEPHLIIQDIVELSKRGSVI